LAQAATEAGGSKANVVDSGLALDVLRFHVTERGTAQNRQPKELQNEYDEREDMTWLVQQLKSRFLLSEPAGAALQTMNDTRLAHDTLAVAVQARYDASDCPGQRARRVLEKRAGEWAAGRNGTTRSTHGICRSSNTGW
jgi:hypothetical protein